MNEYMYPADDPYKILAHSLVGLYRPAEVLRMLTDDSYLLSCVVKEVRLQDIGGVFLDCIIEDILSRKKRMEYMHQLDALAEYYFSQLNKKRLRDELVEVLASAGIEIIL